jgi:nicotinic acid phosphoribosyltransferase
MPSSKRQSRLSLRAAAAGRKSRKALVGGAVAVETDDFYDKPSKDEAFRCAAHAEGKVLLEKWMTGRKEGIDKILALFDAEGNSIAPLNATSYNDLYKWTMMPVIRKLETLKGGVTVTFGIDLRDEKMRAALKSDEALRTAVGAALKKLEARPFNKDMFKAILSGPRAGLLSEEDINAICGPDGHPRTLVEAGGVKEFGNKYVQTPADVSAGKVTITFYENPEAEYAKGEKGVYFIEATGPWHRVSWLETSMMQCVYEAKLRYDLAKKGKSYSQWLYGALLRCAKSVSYTRSIQKAFFKAPPAPAVPPPMTPALFTGRRTGGLAFLLLQNLFFADHFKQFGPLFGGGAVGLAATADVDGTSPCLGTSSCDSWFILTKTLGLPCLNPAGTHAHELSMVSSALFPQLDQNAQHLPVTQVIGHYLYAKLVWEKTGKVGPMPMLPDTLGSRAFLRAATYLTVPEGEGGAQVPFLNMISSARQDSGKLRDFAQNMTDFGYVKGKMASEIDDSHTLLEAAELGYGSFGAGGFFGDSEKVWGDKNASSNSMAVKAVRVMYKSKAGEKYEGIPYIKVAADGVVTGYPIKIGDPADAKNPVLAEGKLSLDKNLPPEALAPIKKYAEEVRVGAGVPGTAGAGSVNGTKELAAIFTIEGGAVADAVVGGAAKAYSWFGGGGGRGRGRGRGRMSRKANTNTNINAEAKKGFRSRTRRF